MASRMQQIAQWGYHGNHLLSLMYLNNGIWDDLGILQRKTHFNQEGTMRFGLQVEHQPLTADDIAQCPFIIHEMARVCSFTVPTIFMSRHHYWPHGRTRTFDLFLDFSFVSIFFPLAMHTRFVYLARAFFYSITFLQKLAFPSSLLKHNRTATLSVWKVSIYIALS